MRLRPPKNASKIRPPPKKIFWIFSPLVRHSPEESRRGDGGRPRPKTARAPQVYPPWRAGRLNAARGRLAAEEKGRPVLVSKSQGVGMHLPGPGPGSPRRPATLAL